MNSKKNSWEGDNKSTRSYKSMNAVPFVDGDISSLEVDFGTPISYIPSVILAKKLIKADKGRQKSTSLLLKIHRRITPMLAYLPWFFGIFRGSSPVSSTQGILHGFNLSKIIGTSPKVSHEGLIFPPQKKVHIINMYFLNIANNGLNTSKFSWLTIIATPNMWGPRRIGVNLSHVRCAASLHCPSQDRRIPPSIAPGVLHMNQRLVVHRDPLFIAQILKHKRLMTSPVTCQRVIVKKKDLFICMYVYIWQQSLFNWLIPLKFHLQFLLSSTKYRLWNRSGETRQHCNIGVMFVLFV